MNSNMDFSTLIGKVILIIVIAFAIRHFCEAFTGLLKSKGKLGVISFIFVIVYFLLNGVAKSAGTAFSLAGMLNGFMGLDILPTDLPSIIDLFNTITTFISDLSK